MKKYFSCYLDLVRFAAAVMVVLDHYVQRHIVSQHAAHFIPDLGREAVIVFFVLSGFVIAYTTEAKKQTFKQYVIARATRIYSVALPLLLAAFALVFVSESYVGKAIPFDYQIAKAYIYIPFHSLFLGELWTFSEKPLWLESYWSLSYEVWYYIFFAAVFFFRGGKRRILAPLIFLILGYKLWLLLPVWYSGVFLWRLQAKRRIGKHVARAGWGLSILLLCAYKYFGCDDYLRMLGNEIWPFPHLSLGSADRYLCDYVVCGIVLLNFYCTGYAEFVSLEKFAIAIKNVSSYTFTLYLAHPLVISIWQYFGFSNVLLLTLLIAISTVSIGLVTEHRRSWISRWLTYLYGYFDRAAHLVVCFVIS